MNVLFATDSLNRSGPLRKFLSRFRFTSADVITILHLPPASAAGRRKFTGVKLPEISLPDSFNAVIRQKTAGTENPERIIKTEALDCKADLIALGLTGSGALIIDSVVRSVAFNSSIPVLIMKKSHCRKADGTKVLFATDGSDAASATGRLLASLPFYENTELLILNVICSEGADILERLGQVPSRASRAEFAESQEIITRSREYLNGKFNSVSGLIKIGDPVIEALNEAASMKTDIIAVGCRGTEGFKGIAGDMPKHLLRHSRCCVLIGKSC